MTNRIQEELKSHIGLGYSIIYQGEKSLIAKVIKEHFPMEYTMYIADINDFFTEEEESKTNSIFFNKNLQHDELSMVKHFIIKLRPNLVIIDVISSEPYLLEILTRLNDYGYQFLLIDNGMSPWLTQLNKFQKVQTDSQEERKKIVDLNRPYRQLLLEEQTVESELTTVDQEIQQIKAVLDNNQSLAELLESKDKQLAIQIKGISDKMKITIQQHYNKLFDKRGALNKRYWELHKETNSGNLRHVVHTLYKEQGLTTSEFAQDIGFVEQDVINLTKNGIVSDRLLTAICSYFRIEKTEKFKRYL